MYDLGPEVKGGLGIYHFFISNCCYHPKVVIIWLKRLSKSKQSKVLL